MSPNKQRLATRIAGLLIVLLVFGPLFLESASDILETFDVRTDKVWVPFFHGRFWYQTVVKAGNRKPRARYVRLVTFVPTREPSEIFDNMCRQRLFMGKLLRRIEESHPAVIVVDKFYSPTSCPDANDKGNQGLSDALRNTDIPIILGLRTLDSNQLAAQKPVSDAEKTGLQKANLVLEPALHFSGGNNVKYGLIRGNGDTRKIPLLWPVFEQRQDLVADRPPSILPTVSKLAAEEFDPTVFAEPRLKGLLSDNVHPFTSFLEENEILTFSAIQLLCDPNLSMPAKWEDCQPGSLGNDVFKNHIVVIGNRTIDDFHPSVIGTVPGVVLQVNYIESLLDGRYFRPVNLIVAIFINSALVSLIVSLFSKSILSHTLSPGEALAWSLTVVALGWVLVYVIALQVGYYLVIWFPGVIALVAIWAHGRAHERAQTISANTQQSGG